MERVHTSTSFICLHLVTKISEATTWQIFLVPPRSHTPLPRVSRSVPRCSLSLTHSQAASTPISALQPGPFFTPRAQATTLSSSLPTEPQTCTWPTTPLETTEEGPYLLNRTGVGSCGQSSLKLRLTSTLAMSAGSQQSHNNTGLANSLSQIITLITLGFSTLHLFISPSLFTIEQAFIHSLHRWALLANSPRHSCSGPIRS